MSVKSISLIYSGFYFCVLFYLFYFLYSDPIKFACLMYLTYIVYMYIEIDGTYNVHTYLIITLFLHRLYQIT